MTTGQPSAVIQHLRRAMLLRDGAGLTDGQLLKDYISRRDEAALAALVRRHGPMVWGVCRRVLGRHHDAEDAFQATFLVLVRRAASTTSPDLLANWLYGVAHQTARKARATTSRRKSRERQVTDMPEPAVVEQDLWNDLQPLLDQELSRLPDVYRVAIVLCDLEGKTRKEAARHLGLPEGTVGSRLARARALLAKRLTGRGITLSAGVLTAVFARNAASAAVPDAVVSSTISAANLFAAGPTAAAGVISPKVVALTEGVLKAMLMSKLKAVIAVVVILGFILVTATASAQKVRVPSGESPEEQRVPDVSGTWQGDGWGTVVLRQGQPGEFTGTYNDTFGKDVGRIEVQWSKASQRYEGKWSEGTYRFGRIALEAVPGGETMTGAYTTDPKCEHQPGVPALASLRWSKVKPNAAPQDKPPVVKEEDFTAWGQEVGGLQAGLDLTVGRKRTFRHGEEVRLIVRIRNVGKKEVPFQYLRQFLMGTSPVVTDDQGKQIPFEGAVTTFTINPSTEKVVLAPGKEIDIYELKLKFRPGSESDNNGFCTLYGTGKFRFQFERLAVPDTDPILSKLPTGKLELEIKSEAPAPIRGR